MGTPLPQGNPGQSLEILWEIPLGILSFGFANTLRWTLNRLSRYYNPLNRQETPQWQVVSAPFLAPPLKLLWAMSRARWNLHALIAIAGPFTVEESLSLAVATVRQGTPSWTAVFYTLGDYETRASLSSLTVPEDQDWATLSLPPGRYLVGLRHYHWANPITLPAIQVDGKPALGAEEHQTPPDFNRFYRDLIQRQSWVHCALNGYVYPLLRYGVHWPALFPPDWIRRVFLPVPNPETQFYYGAIAPGEQVAITLPGELLPDYDVRLSLYNRFCFPLDWYPLTEAHHTTAPQTVKALYIIRVHPRHPQAPPPSPLQIQVQGSA